MLNSKYLPWILESRTICEGLVEDVVKDCFSGHIARQTANIVLNYTTSNEGKGCV